MKKIVLSFLMTLLSLSLVFGQSVSENEAANIAKNFLKKSSSASYLVQKAPTKTNELKLVYAKVDKEQVGDKLFYIYNIKGDNGFVIVSADKRTQSILGYSHTGKFDKNNIPSNLSYWLDNYANEIVYAKKHLQEVSDKAFIMPTMARVAQETTSVSPLLGNINLNQGTPYNDQCPIKDGERTVTGCVATAIVQVMKYHNWPNIGKGSHSYLWNGQTLSVDFSAQTYDWTKIKPFYDDNATDEEKAEIAKLMYHVGVSVEMNYDLSKNGGSGAYTSDGVGALFEYFNYDAGIQVYSKEYFTRAEWNEKIKEELDNGRPVVYSGAGSGGGHAFVCDGYDADGKFHINWGWGGYSNGYFETSALNPSGLGIGGGSGGFNSYQSILVGIQRPVANSEHISVLGFAGFNNIPVGERNRTDKFSLSLEKVYNIGGFDYNGTIQLALMQDDVFIQNFKNYPINALPSNYGYSQIHVNDLSILSSVANGNYQIKFRYKNEKGDMVPLLVRQGRVKVVNVEVTDTKIKFSSSAPSHQVALVEKPVTATNLYYNRPGHIKLKLSNLGDNDYNAQVGLKLVHKTDNSITQELYHTSISVPIGTTEKEISAFAEINVPAGDYYLEVYYDNKNDITNEQFPTTLFEPSEHNRIEVTVLEEPTELTHLSMDDISMANTITIGKDFELTTNISNTGAIYGGKIVAEIFNALTFQTKGEFGLQDLVIDKNQTIPVTFKGNISNLPAGDYIIKLYYKKNSYWEPLSNKTHKFRLIENSTDLTHINKDDLWITVKENSLSVKLPEDNLSVNLFDIRGQLVYQKKNVPNIIEIPTDKLTSGIFLLQVVDNNNHSVVRKISLTK